jgi:hypothetical protein
VPRSSEYARVLSRSNVTAPRGNRDARGADVRQARDRGESGRDLVRRLVQRLEVVTLDLDRDRGVEGERRRPAHVDDLQLGHAPGERAEACDDVILDLGPAVLGRHARGEAGRVLSFDLAGERVRLDADRQRRDGDLRELAQRGVELGVNTLGLLDGGADREREERSELTLVDLGQELEAQLIQLAERAPGQEADDATTRRRARSAMARTRG